MLIDKRGNQGLNLAALHIAAIMQKDHDFWFSLSGGDKDTFVSSLSRPYSLLSTLVFWVLRYSLSIG